MTSLTLCALRRLSTIACRARPAVLQCLCHVSC